MIKAVFGLLLLLFIYLEWNQIMYN